MNSKFKIQDSRLKIQNSGFRIQDSGMAFREKFRSIFYVKDTPRRIALAFAIGVFMGISPFLGFHTIGAFFLAWLFGLNRLVAVVGVYLNNPWTMVPIYTFCTWVGAKLIGMKQLLPDIDWKNITFMDMIDKLAHLILPFFVGTITVGIVAAITSYFIIQIMVTRYKKIQDAT